MLKSMKFQTDMMEQTSRARGQGLSSDPGVALAQVIAPTIQEGFRDVNDTVREVGGLRPKEPKKLRPEDQAKVDQAIKAVEVFDARRKEFVECATCSYVIPKIASQCPRCGTLFEPSKEEVTNAAAEQEKKGKPFVVPKTPAELERIRQSQPKAIVKSPGTQIKKDDTVKDKFPEELRWVEDWFKPEGSLDRLRYKIERGHDAKKAMSGVWSFLEPEKGEDKKLLYVATKGMDFMLEAAAPYIDEFGQRDLFNFFKTTEAKLWMIKAFNTIRELAKADGVILTGEDIMNFEKSIKPYLKKEAETECALCGKSIPLSGWEEHSTKCQQDQLKELEAQAKKEADAKKAEDKKKQEQNISQTKV